MGEVLKDIVLHLRKKYTQVFKTIIEPVFEYTVVTRVKVHDFFDVCDFVFRDDFRECLKSKGIYSNRLVVVLVR